MKIEGSDDDGKHGILRDLGMWLEERISRFERMGMGDEHLILRLLCRTVSDSFETKSQPAYICCSSLLLASGEYGGSFLGCTGRISSLDWFVLASKEEPTSSTASATK